MKSTILIVDDEPSAAAAVEAILDGQGYQLEMAGNGREAIERAEALTPDLILLDVMMPGMNGFDVCRKIRARPRLAEVPIVILTALEDRFFLLQGIEAGADDFLTKPVDRQELIARVGTITRLNRYRTLLEQRESLKEMAGRLISAQEEERRRISRELHDEFGQALTAHNLNLHNLQADLPKELGDIRRRMDLIIAEINDLLGRVRRLAQDLRPPMLDALGFSGAVNTYCAEFGQRAGIPVQCHLEPLQGELPDVQAVTLYRVLQEALTNIARHAQASTIWVDLSADEERLCLMIQDNGVGFDVEATRKNGIGILGMRERLALVGGELDLRSRMGRGTILSAYLPHEVMPKEGREVS